MRELYRIGCCSSSQSIHSESNIGATKEDGPLEALILWAGLTALGYLYFRGPF